MLHLSIYGHVLGGAVLDLLKMAKGIEELTMLIDTPMWQEMCEPRCLCRHHQSWTSEDLSLPLLKKEEFKGFTGSNSSVYVLELLFYFGKSA
uniref:Uncharacterized protein n=1 Tax=Arundo donax TaxID=35708 RepID=A0A0A8YIL2_ARUDO